MKLSAPTILFFVISLVVVILGVLAALGKFSVIPLAPVWIVATGYAILTAGCLFKGV